MDLSSYKLIVFANCFYFAPEQRERLFSRIPETATVVWNYAAGILNPEFSLDHVKELTGLAIEEFRDPEPETNYGYVTEHHIDNSAPCPRMPHDFPLFCIKQEAGAEILNTYPDGKIMTAAKMRNAFSKTVLSAFPSLHAADLQKLAQDAGCRMLAPLNCTVYADNRIIGFFPKDDLDDEVLLPKGCTVNGKDTMKLKIPYHGSAFFLLDK